MKLFVWEKAFYDYGPGMAVAIAPDRGAAIDALVEKIGYTHADLSQTPQEWDLDDITETLAFFVHGGG